jgi:glycosyltransferase involved in cell wall biosynthesis
MPDSTSHIFFIQNRSKRAGAQVSLSRLVTSDAIKSLHPYVLLGDDGWLGNYLTKQTIPYSVKPWPSPRSLGARLGGLDRFARNTVDLLRKENRGIRAVIANDHQECLTALALAKAAANIPVIAILRTPGMSRGDFEKYQCNSCSHLFARGEELTSRVSQWAGREVSCMTGSFSVEDLLPAITIPVSFPTRILVAGSEEPRKGFSDVIEAVRIIENDYPDFPALEMVFTGEKNQILEDQCDTDFHSNFEFAGRIEGFRDFSRQFHLAIHPSRAETFGMAPFELLLAGIPTMLSATGAAPNLPLTAPWIFPPESPHKIAASIIQLWKSWQDHVPDMTAIQKYIMDTYPISNSAEALAEKIDLPSIST